MSINVKVIKNRNKRASDSNRDTFVVDLDVEENFILKDVNRKETIEYNDRLAIVSRIVLANKMKDILLYTNDLNSKDKDALTIIASHLDELAKHFSSLIPASESEALTDFMTSKFMNETHLDGGLTRCNIEVKDANSGKKRTIKVEYYE